MPSFYVRVLHVALKEMGSAYGGVSAASALIGTLGGGYLASASAVFGASALPGEILLVAGTAMLGWNVARYGALLSGEQSTRDNAQSARLTPASDPRRASAVNGPPEQPPRASSPSRPARA